MYFMLPGPQTKGRADPQSLLGISTIWLGGARICVWEIVDGSRKS